MILPKRTNIRIKDFDYSLERAYFITICSNNKAKVFCDQALTSEIIDLLKSFKNKLKYKVYVYCFMPDHLHLLISPSNSGIPISKFIGGFKSISTKIAWKHNIKGKLWQIRFYDHILRKNEELMSVGMYILNNPVRKNLTDRWEDYGFCGIIDNW